MFVNTRHGVVTVGIEPPIGWGHEQVELFISGAPEQVTGREVETRDETAFFRVEINSRGQGAVYHNPSIFPGLVNPCRNVGTMGVALYQVCMSDKAMLRYFDFRGHGQDHE